MQSHTNNLLHFGGLPERSHCKLSYCTRKKTGRPRRRQWTRCCRVLAEGHGRGGEELLDELSLAAECSGLAKQLLMLAGKDGKHTLTHTRMHKAMERANKRMCNITSSALQEVKQKHDSGIYPPQNAESAGFVEKCADLSPCCVVAEG